MSNRLKVVSGDRFGQLVVLDEVESRTTPNGSIVRRMRCRCDCGQEKVVALGRLRSGGTRSCGCLVGRNPRSHVGVRTIEHLTEYRTWLGILKRCSDASDRNYGGRGIKVCDRWRGSFGLFFKDMGPRPSDEHSIDRINNDGDYEPGNCRWATRKEQARNTSVNVMVTHNGETLCVSEWAERFGIHASLLNSRLQSGWSFEDAVSRSSYEDRGFYMTPISKRTSEWYREYEARGSSLSGQVAIWTNR